MTGNPDMKTAVQAVELGAIQYLIKPFEIGEVGAIIARAVRLNRMARLKREALARHHRVARFAQHRRAGFQSA